MPLVDWTYSSYLYSGSSTNHLKVRHDGSQIKLYANGHYLRTKYDSRYTGERYVGLQAESFDHGWVDARFDNFRVEGLSGGSPEPGAASYAARLERDERSRAESRGW